MKQSATKNICSACGKRSTKFRRRYCNRCKIFMKGIDGRDRNREKIRIRRNHTCYNCKQKWVIGTRRFHVHHLGGLCGFKSRSYDRMSEAKRLRVLCPKCHTAAHGNHNTNKKTMVGHALRILKMREEGKTYDAIGRVFNVKSSSVHGFLSRHLKFDDMLQPYEV